MIVVALHEEHAEEVARLHAELAARPTRGDVLREAAPELDTICEEYGVLGVGDRLRRMADAAERKTCPPDRGAEQEISAP